MTVKIGVEMKHWPLHTRGRELFALGCQLTLGMYH